MDDRYAIQRARTEIREGYETGNPARILNVYSDSVSDMSADQPSFSGANAKAVLRARLEQMFSKHRVHCAPACIEVLLFGDKALDYGWQELSLTPLDGSPAVQRRTRYVSLWQKEKDGGWRIALWIDNPDRQPMLADQLVAHLNAGSLPPGAKPLASAAEIGGKPLQQPFAEA